MVLSMAIHTASPDLGLAIATQPISGQPQFRQQVWALDRALSTDLHRLVLAFLPPQTWADLDYLAVAIGPGGFTGTRIGVVMARTLAQQLQIPLFGISTLAAIAQHQVQTASISAPFLAVTMPAQRGELFGGVYQLAGDRDRPELIVHTPDAVYTPTTWQAHLATLPEVQLCEIAKGQGLGDQAIAIAQLAQHQWQQGQRPEWPTVVPFYGQHPVTA